MIQRKAYDLFNHICRQHFKDGIKIGKWKKWWWIKLVCSDTYNRVCSRKIK